MSTPEEPLLRKRSCGWWCALLGFAVLVGMQLACARNPDKDERPPVVIAAKEPDLFRDVTAGSGVDFTYRNGEEAKSISQFYLLVGSS